MMVNDGYYMVNNNNDWLVVQCAHLETCWSESQ